GKAGKTAGDFEWIAGDALNPQDVSKAAEGVSLIVHAVNPPGYRDWEKLVVPMLDNTIAAARRVGARVLLPGTVYNFGPDAFPVLGEDSPQHPVTRKGRLRVMMEQR
ncbi:NAD-dependent epimerase, partial [Escherichia coli]|nr:NAD-dependent epimerase [Escherichia coli]